MGALLCAWGAGLQAAPPDLQASATSDRTTVRQSTWTMLSGRVVNRSTEDVQGRLVVAESDNLQVQFSTSVWAPAKSMSRVPIPFVTTLDGYGSQVKVDIKLFDGDGGPGSPILFPTPNMQPSPQPLPIDEGDFATAMYWDLHDNAISDMLMRLRASKMRKGGVADFDRGRNRPFPSNVLSLLCFSDMLMATSDRLTPVQAQAVRQWLVQGGHLWLMADRVNPEAAKLVLGDEWTLEKAGETELANVVMEEDPHRGVARTGVEKSGPFEEPIRMVRVVATGMDVTHRIGKWPAIMWRNVGRGQLLVTTFDVAAMEMTKGQEPEWYKEIADRWLTPGRILPPGAVSLKPAKGTTHAAMDEMASGLVAHGVVGRWWVLGVLGSMCALLLLAGCVLLLKNRFSKEKVRLEMLAPVAVVLAVVATAAMLFLGAQTKGDLPLTLATMNDARVVAPADVAAYSGAVNVYSPSAFEGTIKIPVGGWVLPDLSLQSGHIVRMTWRELDPMRWEHLRFPSAATLRNSMGGAMKVGQTASVVGSFNKDGVELELNGAMLADAQELRLVGPSGRFQPLSIAGNRFSVGPDEQLQAGNESGVGAVTHTRSEFIKAMQPSLAQAPRDSATLFAWTKVLDPGAEIEPASAGKPSRLAWSLAALPVEFRAAAPGAAVTVPSGLMKLSSHRIRGLTTGAPYNDTTGEFQKGKIFSQTTGILRFQLPAPVKSLHVEEAEVKLKIVASSDRTVRLVAIKPDGKTERDLKDLVNPVKGSALDVIKAKVKDIPEIQPDADGNILLGLDVSKGESETSSFEIEDFTLQVKGRIKAETPAESTK